MKSNPQAATRDYKKIIIIGLAALLVLALIALTETSKVRTDLEARLAACARTGAENEATCAEAVNDLRSAVRTYAQILSRGNSGSEGSTPTLDRTIQVGEGTQAAN